ncbi:NIPSNAP family protein [Maribellus comscasis]|nr:NIPSNAP family protein [Maribellus comscasis]
MKSNKQLKIIALFLFAVTLSLSGSARDYYQLKVYNLKDKDQETLVDNYLKNAYLPALHRAGVKQVGIFKPVDASGGMKIIVFIPLKNVDQFEKLETTLLKDKKFQTDGTDYINASWENPPYERMESIILRAFSDMPEFAIPAHKTPASERIYELRSYEGPTEKYYRKKVEMFNEGGEITIFKNVGSQPVFFGEVLSGSTMPNLMYMTTYSDMKSHDEHWNAFRTHPDWKELSAKEEYKHTVSNSVIQLLHPTEYSDF